MQVYQVFCNDEDAYFETTVYTANSTLPSRCPNNHTHTINPNKTILIRDVQSMFINSKSYESTQGYYMMRGNQLAITDATPGSVAVFDLPFVTPVCVYGLNAQIAQANVGDYFDLVMNPETIVGVLAADAQVGAINFIVSDSVVQYMKPGFSMAFMDPLTGAKTPVGEVVSVNIDADNITVATNSAVASIIPAGTYVLLSLYVAREIHAPNTNPISIGYGTMAGKPVPMGTIARVVYHNVTGGAKTFSWMLEYTY